jgi:hypothetical protein
MVSDFQVFTLYLVSISGESIFYHVSEMLPQLKSRIAQQKENAKPAETEVSKKKQKKK